MPVKGQDAGQDARLNEPSSLRRSTGNSTKRSVSRSSSSSAPHLHKVHAVGFKGLGLLFICSRSAHGIAIGILQPGRGERCPNQMLNPGLVPQPIWHEA